MIILDALVNSLTEKLVDIIINEIHSFLNVESEMESLDKKVKRIPRLLEDAESKKIETKKALFWLAEFREVMYDTEDLLDDIQFHAEAKATAVTTTSKNSTKIKKWLKMAKEKFIQVISQPSKLMSDVDFKREIAIRIKNINERLDRLDLESTTVLGLENLPNKDHHKVSSDNTSRPTGTISMQIDSEIVGIDDEATELADQIMSNTKSTHSVFAIVGMGGIGKSTLARKIINLDNIKRHFETTIWVYVSRNWNGEDVLKDIVRLINEKYDKNHSSREELSQDFVKIIQDKSVFIVLDDVWDSRVWKEYLETPLVTGAKHNTRILITTRNEKVAKEMDVAKPHQMKTMPLEVGWLLLKKNVFREADDVMNDHLEEIGKKIVEKCEYLPLAIKAVGGVLKFKEKTTYVWEKVLKNEIWSTGNLPEDVKASLLLSYEDLPSHLKQCLTYFSVLRILKSFGRGYIVNLWIAEGLIEKMEGMNLEESGEYYYDELMMRNLLQSKSINKYAKVNTMHDLVHSLTLFLTRKQYIYVQHSDSIKLRHLCFFNNKDLDSVPEEIKKQDYVRTLFLKMSPLLKTITSEHLSHLRRLRVLDLSQTGIEELPDEIGTLLQLTYLDISNTEIQKLPESIKNLKNLELLYAWGLKYLHTLPTGITELINLRIFKVKGLRSMPPGMYNMKNLTFLRDFVVSEVTNCTEGGSQSTTNVKELKDLSKLCSLDIKNFEKVASKEEAEVAAIENKISLKRLILESNYQEDQEFDDTDIQKNEEVFTGIMVPINLKVFSIYGFIGRELPGHIFNAKSLGQLTYLYLNTCLLVKQLPCLGDLPNLERLVIQNAPLVTELGPEFFASSKFPKLQLLKMEQMINLEKMFEVEEGAFPCMEKLYIIHCHKLKSLNQGWPHAKCLKYLSVKKLENLESIENFTCISELKLRSNSRLTSLKNLPSLKILKAFDCPSLREVKDAGELNELFVSAVDEEQSNAPEWVHNMIPSPKKIILTES